MEQRDLARMPPGELERMSEIAANSTSWGNAGQQSFAREVKEAMLTPGESIADTIMRGALKPQQVPAAVRLLAREMWLHKMAGGKMPKGMQDLSDLPHGTFVVAMTGLLQAAADGQARHQTLMAMTGGLLQFGQSAASGITGRIKRKFGRGNSSEGLAS